jgi:PRTRC genetic system protein E
MNFFQQLAGLELVGNLKLTVTGSADKMVVSVLLDNDKCGDDARKHIPPLLLKGSAAEMDGEFFSSIATPLQKSSGLMVNMETYLKGQEEAKKKSAMAKEVADKETKEKEAKKKRYDEFMKKVADLEKDKKYKEAIAALPDVTTYPEHATAIEARKKELSKHTTVQKSIFDELPPETGLPDHLEAEQKANQEENYSYDSAEHRASELGLDDQEPDYNEDQNEENEE